MPMSMPMPMPMPMPMLMPMPMPVRTMDGNANAMDGNANANANARPHHGRQCQCHGRQCQCQCQCLSAPWTAMPMPWTAMPMPIGRTLQVRTMDGSARLPPLPSALLLRAPWKDRKDHAREQEHSVPCRSAPRTATPTSCTPPCAAAHAHGKEEKITQASKDTLGRTLQVRTTYGDARLPPLPSALLRAPAPVGAPTVDSPSCPPTGRERFLETQSASARRGADGQQQVRPAFAASCLNLLPLVLYFILGGRCAVPAPSGGCCPLCLASRPAGSLGGVWSPQRPSPPLSCQRSRGAAGAQHFCWLLNHNIHSGHNIPAGC